MRPEDLYPAIVTGPDRTDSDKAEIITQQQLVDVLLDWESVCAKRDRPVTVNMIELYARVLTRVRATPQEVEDARDSLLEISTFFPTPAEIVAWIKSNRQSNRYEGWIDALDGQGGTILCPREKAHAGYYRPEPPEGECNDGRGCAAMAEYADIRRDIRDKRALLGVKTLTEATPEQMESVGVRRSLTMPSALPIRRETITPEKEAELLAQAERTRADRLRQRESEQGPVRG